MTDIALVGEAWGETEEREHRAFAGAAGWELNKLLDKAGIRRADCLVTNVFNLRPPSNKIEAFCTDKMFGIPGLPALGTAGYVHKKYLPELERLADELEAANPNVTVALGNTAMWALLGKTSISKLRGTVQLSTHTLTGLKVLPTYHPAAIFRQYSLRPIVVLDLRKARRESEYPDIRLPERHIWIEPTLEDIYEFDRLYISQCKSLAVDIETSGTAITCIGFAPREDLAIVIPGIGLQKAGRPYWPSMAIERKVWAIVKNILERPVPKVFQNGLYDITVIWRAWGIGVRGVEHDTMLLHHALQPESLKGLGFLGSLYTDEGAWKQMRESKATKFKRDD
jgi:uracil-DNA glycosylase